MTVHRVGPLAPLITMKIARKKGFRTQRPSARRVANTRRGFSCQSVSQPASQFSCLAWLEKKWPSDLWPGLMRREVVRRCPNRDGCPLASPCVGTADGGAPRARLLRGARGGDSIPVPNSRPLAWEKRTEGLRADETATLAVARAP